MGFFGLHLGVSSAAKQRKVPFSIWPARLRCNCLQGPASAPDSSSNVPVASGEALYIFSSPVWAVLMSELILHWFFQHLIHAGIFLSLNNAFQQGAQANFQVFPVFLLSDASRLQCCREWAQVPFPFAHWAGGCSIWVVQRHGLLLEKQNLWQGHLLDPPFIVWGASSS